MNRRNKNIWTSILNFINFLFNSYFLILFFKSSARRENFKFLVSNCSWICISTEPKIKNLKSETMYGQEASYIINNNEMLSYTFFSQVLPICMVAKFPEVCVIGIAHSKSRVHLHIDVFCIFSDSLFSFCTTKEIEAST